MKLFKSRKFSIVLALVLVLTSFSFTAMAADGDVVVKTINDLGTLAQAASNLADENKVNANFVYDEILGENVLQYTSESYGPTGSASYNAPGAEARHYLATSSGGQLVDGSKKYLIIEFNVKIANANDGIAFRMGRYGEDGNLLTVGTSTASDNYFVIGGSSASWNTVNNGFRYRSQALSVGQWHNVVMELGASLDTQTVRYFVDGKQVTIGAVASGNEQVKETQTKTETNAETGETEEVQVEVVTSNPGVDENGTVTYTRKGQGFGGATGNRCIMSPISLRGNALDTRLSGFTMTSTDTAYSTDNYEPLNKVIFDANDTSATFVSRSKVTKATVDAKDFADYKDALSFTGTTSGESLGSKAGEEAGWTLVPGMTANTNESLGGLDWTKYKNLRIQFNLYIGGDNNSVYLRILRTADGSTYNKTDYNYVIGIGDDGSNTGVASTGCTVRYRELELGKWHNVVMELGANKDNTYIVYYVDGVKVYDGTFANAETAYGFGATSENYAMLAMRNVSGSTFDIQMSDVTMMACNNRYNPANVPAPSIDGVVSGGLTYRVDTANKAITYVADRDTDGMSVADFKVSNVDYFGATDSNNTKVIVYNDTSKRVDYYTLSEQTDVLINEVQAETKDGRLYVKFDYNYVPEEADETENKAYKLIVAFYQDNVLNYLRADTWCTIPVGLSASSYDLKLPTTIDYNKIKVFLWGNTATEPVYTIIPKLKSAELDVQ